ncbi:hypothetical protein JTE90_006939 [Oedothorax gibbosus]|uniref:Peptidase S1 domain-containing protein n=1 Tax=Oedothorax gibbosus TaxID=931172 RepID=A0AAV6TUD9_9ARAC|nr:hypothetical protein JTE90_006939 [Oedothorax gibbosus]
MSDASANIETEGLIVGGTFADPGEYPFVAEFILRDANGARFLCAGSILSQWWIVTAAHCLQHDPSYVTVGQYDRTKISPYAVRHNVAFSVIHRLYKTKGNFNNDIALLKMDKSIVFNDYVKPANIPTSDVDYSGRTGTIIGWGLIQTGGTTSSVLRELQVVIEGYEKCGRTYIQNLISDGPSSYEVCVKSNINQGACGGDSGGPLIVREGNKDVVIGLTSRGLSQCGTEIPEIYVLIYKFRNWIAGVMQRYTRTTSIQGGRVRKIRA